MWKALADYATCGVAVVNAAGVIVYANPHLERNLGLEPGFLVNQPLVSVLVAEDQEGLSALLATPPPPTDPRELQWHFRHTDGSRLLFHLRALSLPPEATAHGEILLNLWNVNAAERAKRTLQRRNLELALLNQAGRAFSASLDSNEVLATVLEEVRKLMGVVACSIWLIDPETEELVCRQATGPKKELVVGWRLPKGEGIVGAVATSGKSLNVNDVMADDRHFSGVDAETGLALRSIVSVPLRVQDKVIGVIQALDTTVNRFKPSDLTLLEALGASAAIAIDNARLVEALRRRSAELEVSNRELEAFAHTVAHDLKAPLTHVIGYADVLYEMEDEVEASQRREYLQTIRRSSRKMASIIDELLLLAELRKEVVQLSPLNMDTIVAEALERIQPLATRMQARIEVPETWPKALGYGPWIEEVWVNYLSNALKYGGKRPHVELGGTPRDDDRVSFWVRDHGPGLSEEEQARLFVPFTNLDKVNTKGYGLGLSIVYRIVEKLDGEVWVKSAPGQGSTFGFTLPRAEEG